MKLNLGCGRKLKDGYVNVDLVERADTQGFEYVKADVFGVLPFESDSVDEILAVHILEHVYFWEAKRVLEEWLRVLKPGGKLIVECPDFIKAAWFVIKSISNDNPIDPRLTMWVFWGDPSHKDPYMCHKWGWSASTLLEFLAANFKLQHCAAAEAKYHLGELRDFRVEAIK